MTDDLTPERGKYADDVARAINSAVNWRTFILFETAKEAADAVLAVPNPEVEALRLEIDHLRGDGRESDGFRALKAHLRDQRDAALAERDQARAERDALRAGMSDLADDARGIRNSEPHGWVEDALRVLLGDKP